VDAVAYLSQTARQELSVGKENMGG
jgi:hypothetical protein